MSEQAKKLVPEKRFSEFRSAEEWELSQFSEVYNLHTTNSYSRDMLNYENGSVKNIHYGDIHTKFQILFDITKETVPFINPSESLEKIKPESYCVEGDIVFADASEDLAGVGKSIEIVNLNNEPLLSGLHTLLARQKDNKLVIGFGGHLFKSAGIRKQIQKESQGAKVLGISGGRLSGIKVYFPSDKQEQQKITDCLSSLDDLITAQSQKVEALKQHKKGLMQQLFPAEGETFPKLRFPEFENEPWNIKPLGKVADNLDFKRVPITESDRKKGATPYYGASGIIDYVEGYIFDEDLLCISEDGANLVARSYPIAFSISGKTWVNNHAHVLKFKKKFTQTIIENYLNSISLEDYLTGMAQPKLNQAKLEIIPIPLPENEDEQKKIANLLSSMDELITTQIQKLEAYKPHKNGLMQQLFPSLKGIEK
ncbi:MAG: restriction endonuclease subunit S [Methylotenera sp.]|nr:restriction endonuclease subunit S [Methylotenera sp.]